MGHVQYAVSHRFGLFVYRDDLITRMYIKNEPASGQLLYYVAKPEMKSGIGC